jgi:hypothetical protein
MAAIVHPVKTLVRPSTVERHLDNESRKTLPVDAGFGVASSSCSSAAVARHAGIGERKAT